MFKVLQKNGKSDLGIIKVCIRITWEMTYCTCSRKPTKMADDTNYLLSVEKALLLVMVLVKLTILVNKVHFRGVRGGA